MLLGGKLREVAFQDSMSQQGSLGKGQSWYGQHWAELLLSGTTQFVQRNRETRSFFRKAQNLLNLSKKCTMIFV